MKTFAVSSYMLESRFGLENGLKMIKESGFDGVDYDLSYDGPSGNGPCYWETAPLTDFDRIKKAITDAGLGFGFRNIVSSKKGYASYMKSRSKAVNKALVKLYDL